MNSWRKWFCFPLASNCNPLVSHHIILEKSCLMVLAYQPPTSQNNLWRSRLVWSRARDWKSRNRQKRFKSSNLFFSATERQSCETRRVAFFLCSQPCLHEFASIRKAKMRSIAGLLTMAGDLLRKEMFVAEQRLTSSSTK